MDLIKIGKYIAGKRKALHLTQKQLAEKLGMSDKSVSKWERGVCLPDVSVYMELCGILGIGINEFLAGEDIGQEDLVRKSEDNLIQVTTDSKHRQNRLRRIIAVLLAAAILAFSAMGFVLYRTNRPRNVIAPLAPESAEMKTAELLSGADGAFLYRYHTDDSFKRLTVCLSIYKSGELIDRTNSTVSYESVGSPAEGMIVLVPDFERFSVKLLIAGEGTRLSSDLPILEGVEGRTYYGRSACAIREETPIRYDEEQGLVALIYGKEKMRVGDIRDYEEDSAPAENDFVYYFSVRFSKEP